MTVSTGAAVQRAGCIKELTLPDPQAIVGLPVLNTDQQDSLESLLGRVVNAGTDAEGLWADIQIFERAEWLMDAIEAGIITSASIGYGVLCLVKSTDRTTGQAIRTILPSISEISFVPVPAAKGANVRNTPMPEDLIETTPAENRAAIRLRARRRWW